MVARSGSTVWIQMYSIELNGIDLTLYRVKWKLNPLPIIMYLPQYFMTHFLDCVTWQRSPGGLIIV